MSLLSYSIIVLQSVDACLSGRKNCSGRVPPAENSKCEICGTSVIQASEWGGGNERERERERDGEMLRGFPWDFPWEFPGSSYTIISIIIIIHPWYIHGMFISVYNNT